MDFKITLFILLVVLSACNTKNKTYYMATGEESSSYSMVGEEIASLLNAQYDWNIKIERGDHYNSVNNCRKLLAGEVDFAFAQNDTPISDLFENDTTYDIFGIRTVLPIYPEVVFIIYPESISEPTSLESLLEGRRVGLGDYGSGSAKLILALFNNFGIDTTRFTAVYGDPDENQIGNPEIDISCSVIGLNNQRIEQMIIQQGGKLFSLGDENLANESSSSVDGFCLNYPRARPFIIPKKTYNKKPSKPILTVATDAVLLTRTDVNDRHVYEMTRAIFKNMQHLANKNRLLLFLNEKFDLAALNFPLHQGAINYLERNEPSFFERYAELIGVLFSIVVVLVGAGASLKQQLRRKKKDRIDIYYEKLLGIESILENGEGKGHEKILKEVMELKRTAYQQLIREKLAANESFRIFIQFANEVVARVEREIQRE